MDWDFHRKDFIEFMHDTTSNYLNGLHGLTPIEKITAIELLYFTIRHGTDNVSSTAQRTIGKFTVDFVVETKFPFTKKNPLKIIIECDGHDFHEKSKQQVSKDKARDRFFTVSGYKVLRYAGSDIVHRPNIISDDLDALFLEYLS